MGIFEDLQEKMRGLEDKAIHDGYWYRISDALIIMICGLLCRQQKLDGILEEFGIEKIFSRAQFYNLLALVNAEEFKLLFSKWMQNILSRGLKGKTVSIDGKTVCGTDKLTKDGSVLHIASAVVSELKLVI